MCASPRLYRNSAYGESLEARDEDFTAGGSARRTSLQRPGRLSHAGSAIASQSPSASTNLYLPRATFSNLSDDCKNVQIAFAL